MRLAGTYHPIEYILFRIPDLFPGIESSAAIYRKDKSIRYVSKNIESKVDQYKQTVFQALRGGSNRFKWVDADFFEKKNSEKSIQRTLIDESEQQSLIIPIESNEDGRLDLLLLNFKNVIKIFSVDRVFKDLTSSEKNLLGEMIYHMLNSEASRVLDEKKLLSQFKNVQENQQKNKEKLEEEVKELHYLHKNHVERFVLDIISENSLSKSHKIQTDQSFIQALVLRKLSFQELKQNVNDSIDTAFHLNFGTETIQLSNIHLSKVNVVRNSQNEKESDKTLQLLNRYEEAALNILEDRLIVNGKNIAAYLNISPPAVTDAIKKHNKRISFLINRYPDRWINIKKGLKPIQNITDQQNHRIAI